MSLISSVIGAEATPLAQECLPSNDTLSSGVSPVINLFTGAIGGVIDDSVTFVVVTLVLGVIFFALSRNSMTLIKGILLALAAPIGAIILIIIYNALTGGLNTVC